MADSIVAYFVIKDTFNLIFNINPTGSGNISLDGFTPPTYSYTKTYNTNNILNLIASPQPGYIFDRWKSSVLGFNPSIFDTNVTITVTSVDSIVAQFLYIDTFDITYSVNPFGAGDIAINTILPLGYPHTESYITNTLVNRTISLIKPFLTSSQLPALIAIVFNAG